MLKALVNEARLRLDITTMGPLLIKTGYATIIGADMAPVLTYRNGQREVYLPGSSLKGVFRSHIEKVINSIKPKTACNPLLTQPNDKDDRKLYLVSCGARFNNKKPPLAPHEVYAESCPTCRLFGSTSFGSRVTIEDAYLPAGSVGLASLVEHRDGIAVDRLTGGTGEGKKFDLEVVTSGTTFTTDIRLRNFEIWQLGILFVIIQDMEDELVRLGSGRSRGLGKIKASINEQPAGQRQSGVALSTSRTGKNEEPDDELWGLGRWLGEEASIYRTQPDDMLRLSSSVAHTPGGVRYTRIFKGETLRTLKEQCIEAFVKQMQAWPPVSEAAAQRSR